MTSNAPSSLFAVIGNTGMLMSIYDSIYYAQFWIDNNVGKLEHNQYSVYEIPAVLVSGPTYADRKQSISELR